MYMILEYCNEGTLATALDPLPFEEKRNRMKETGHILARLHRHGWAHGDVKPGNAGLCRGKVKFFDFGCAESVEFKRPKGSKWAWGTAGFLPPLQHADQQQQTFQETPFTTDVFAFASTLYTIFSKRSLRDDLLQTFPSTDTPVAALFFWGTEPQIFTEIEHTFSGDNLLIHLLKGSLNFKKRFTMERVINHSF
jgi:serine/threonine protein kinase